MADVTGIIPLNNETDPAGAGREFLAEMDTAYDHPDHLAAIDATCTAMDLAALSDLESKASAAPNHAGQNPTVYIDPELQAWIDPLSPAELAGLEASLLAEGCRDPLVVWCGWLLDGHNRHALCTKHGIAFQTVEKTGLVTKEDAKIWMVENQLNKRNPTDFVRVALMLKLKPLVEARAKARMLAGRADPSLNSDDGPVRTDESIAKAAGVGRDTVRKVEKIIEKASAEVIEKVRTGELSINAAAKTVAPPKLPKTKVEIENTEPGPKAATSRRPPEQGEVAVANVDEMMAEITALREEVADLKIALAETLAENEQMGRVFEANDQIKASMAELARFQALAENAERTLAARSHEFNERARSVAYWKKRAEKAERMLADAEAASDPSASFAENAHLHAQIGDLYAELQNSNAQLNAQTSDSEALAAQLADLTAQLEEALNCHNELRAILKAVPLLEMPSQLHQVLELTRTFESRVAEAPHHYANPQCEQEDVTHSVEGEVVVYCEHNAEPTRTESIKYQASATDSMVQVPEGESGVELDAAAVPEDDQQVAKFCNQ